MGFNKRLDATNEIRNSSDIRCMNCTMNFDEVASLIS